MRQPAYNDGPGFAHLLKVNNWSCTVVLLVIYALVFIVECAVSPHPLAHTPDNFFIDNYLALSLDGLKHGFVWQLFTYQFLHAGILHLVCNGWAIYMFGRILEDVLGARNFLLITLSSGVLGGLFQMLAAVVWPQQFDGAVVGASAGAFGLVAAFATLFPERQLTMLVYFVLPIRMRAKTLLWISAGLAFAGIIFVNFFDNLMGGHIANAAHLGGMVMGVVYARKIILGRWFQGVGLAYRHQPGFVPAPVVEAPAPKYWRARPVVSPGELSADELLKTQVDPILDKISAHGLQSLTAREREILEMASGKLAKR